MKGVAAGLNTPKILFNPSERRGDHKMPSG